MLEQLKRYETTLKRFQVKARSRQLSVALGIPFSTNDYLALADSSHLKHAVRFALDKGVSVGAGSSRLISGNLAIYEELEELAADFFKSEKSLFFNCGYMANLAIFTTLPQRDDHVFYDECVHASMLDGISASKAKATAFRHNDFQDLTTKLNEWRDAHSKGYPWIAIESLYSMEGDFAQIPDLIKLARQYQGFIVVDEAHATGVYGENGEGLMPASSVSPTIISVHTCGKALGAAGAIVALNSVFHDYLVNRARTFIYTTAPSPLNVAAVHAAINVCKYYPDYRLELKCLVDYANHELENRFQLPITNSQIIPIVLKSNVRTLQITQSLHDAGFHVKAMRPPTVSEGTARLRLSISRHITHDHINALYETLLPLLGN